MKKFLPTEILSQRNIFRAGILIILLPMTLLAFLLLSRMSTQCEPEVVVSGDDNRDMLAYVSAEDTLMLYDPHNCTETTLLDNVGSFEIGRDGRIAFTKRDEADNDLYVFDSSTPEITPINVSQNPSVNNYPLAWSPDGRYLAFASYQDRYDKTLYIWDGETTTNITPDNGLDTAAAFYIDWSGNGRLAFIVEHGRTNFDIPSEIYVWDGSATTNLSQNPERWDGQAIWNTNGQLLFSSEIEGGEYGVYVWDGVSFRDGSPDVDSFIRVAPELVPYDATWTDDGFIAFTVYADTGEKEIIVWSLEAKAIVSRLPVSSDNAESWLAEGGQVILSSHLASGIPSVYLDVENTEGEVLFSTHSGEFSWSADGYLAYCGIDGNRSQLLSIWNGEETWLVATVSYKPAQWLNGGNTFSCNNG